MSTTTETETNKPKSGPKYYIPIIGLMLLVGIVIGIIATSDKGGPLPRSNPCGYMILGLTQDFGYHSIHDFVVATKPMWNEYRGCDNEYDYVP
jgi:hypothetical protein